MHQGFGSVSAPYDIGEDSSVDKKYFKAKNEVGFKQ